jgi:hypothetical protein
MRTAAKAFGQVMGSEATDGVSYPADGKARLEAGFTQSEVDLTAELAHRQARNEDVPS